MEVGWKRSQVGAEGAGEPTALSKQLLGGSALHPGATRASNTLHFCWDKAALSERNHTQNANIFMTHGCLHFLSTEYRISA